MRAGTEAGAPADSKKSLEEMKADYARPATIPFPSTNPYTPEKAELGRRLYFDPRLSHSGSQSCASCHNPGLSWGDGLGKGIGSGMKQLGRRSPTVLNAAWGSIFFWDGRAGTLEEQALGPIQSPGEMNMPIEELIKKLSSIPGYPEAFAAVFPGEGLKPETVARSIATFERTIVSPDTPFDRWIAGDEKAISASAKNGFTIFNTKAACNGCHSGWNFTDDSFHDIGLPGDDIGRGKFLPQTARAQHAFKTPGLREVATRRPYMHDGSLATLEAVVEHYDVGGLARPSRSELIKPLGLTAQEKADLVAFLRSLGAPQLVAASLPALPN
jgi:cytochrome c peroxidase